VTPPGAGRLVVVACMKRVELRAGVDPLTGDVIPDPASAGASPSDEAALEWALRIAEASGANVTAVSVGGPECDGTLREAIAAGARRAVRVPIGAGPADMAGLADVADVASPVVARALARAVAFAGASSAAPSSPPGDPASPGNGSTDPADVVVCCGDASVDRGSGSVPAFLADELAIAQGLGLVGVSLVTWSGSDGRDTPAGEDRSGDFQALDVERRLDRGRRERLRLVPPFVISLEAGTARLRRASLQRTLASRAAVVEVLPAEAAVAESGVVLLGCEPYRPRPRVVPPPAGLGPRARIENLTGALHERPAARTVVLDAEAAAGELLDTLAAWGELPEDVLDPSVDAKPEPDAMDVP
jgi:electron transfer flavoprotein beta subunit